MIRPASPANPAGFTLIEVMLASAILLIGIAGLVSGLSSANVTSSHQRYMTQALHICEANTEALLLRTAGDAVLASGSHGPLLFDMNGAKVASGGVFAVTWTVAGDVPIGGMKRLSVTTTWTENSGEKSVSLTTDRR